MDNSIKERVGHPECMWCAPAGGSNDPPKWCRGWTKCPYERHVNCHKAGDELVSTMHHLANAARPALELGLRDELVATREALEVLYSKVSAIHAKEVSPCPAH